jgi:alcohol-forming fatty acyl-CoA reductase
VVPKFRHKIVTISGDCSIAGLGLSLTDRQTLMSNINILFHAAATIKFDENLKLAIDINVHGTKDVIDLGKEMKQLKVCKLSFCILCLARSLSLSTS